MSTSTELLSRDGPLAYVWLAANLERKLTKQQLLNASISESTKAIAASSYVAPSSRIDLSQGIISQTNASQEVVSLRITGQLLYGVVKIYSRKTRYLYEDVSDALLKLKSAILRSESVILPVQSTVISSINNITLKDTITDVDLLYQEPFDFGDLEAFTSQNSQLGISQKRSNRKSYPFGDSQLPNADDSASVLFDDSIEIGRRAEPEDDLQDHNEDLELDLNFDIEENDDNHDINLSSDNEGSIEVGRAALDDANASALQLQSDPVDIDDLLPEFHQPELDFDMDDGMDFGGDDFGNAPAMEDMSFNLQTIPGTRRSKKRSVQNYRITDVVRTLRKRVISDQVIELTYDVMQQNRANFPVIREPYTSNNERELSTVERLKLVTRSSNPVGSLTQSLVDACLNGTKRRRLDPHSENVDEENQLQLSGLPDLVHNDDIFETAPESVTDAQQQDDPFEFQDFGGIDEPDFLEEEPQAEADDEGEFLDAQEYDDSELIPEINSETSTEEYTTNVNVISKSTIKVAGHLRELVPEKSTVEAVVSFGDLMLKDLESEEPLSKSEKKQATRTFFELLVIATGDAVGLKQETLFGDIQITARDSLYSKFM